MSISPLKLHQVRNESVVSGNEHGKGSSWLNLLTKYLPSINFILMGILTIFCLYQNILFIRNDTLPYDWDSSANLEGGLRYLEKLKEGRYYDFFFSYMSYPPLAYQVFGILYHVVGSLKYATVIFNFFFIVMTAFLLKLFLKHTAEFQLVLSLVLFFFLVGFIKEGDFFKHISFTWLFMLDLPSLAFSILAYVSLLVSLRHRIISLFQAAFFSFMVGAAIYTRTQAAFFLVFPVIVFVIKSLLDKKYFHLILFILALIVPLNWYRVNFQQIQAYAAIGLSESVDRSLTTGINGFFYSLSLIRPLIIELLPLYVLVIFSLFKRKYTFSFSFKKLVSKVESLFKEESIFLIGAGVGFIFLLFIANKQIRYLFPVVTFFSLGMGVLLAKKNQYLASIATFFILLWSFYKAIFLLPTPKSQAYAFEYVTSFVEQEKTDVVAYYFENDSILFNLNNLVVYHLDKGKLFLPVNNPNLFAPSTTQNGCDIPVSTRYLVVYSNLNITNPKENFDFETNCYETANTFDLLLVSEKHFPMGERVRIFKVNKGYGGSITTCKECQ